MRYKQPGETRSKLVEQRLRRLTGETAEPSPTSRLAASMTELALVLRESPYRGGASLERA